MWRTIAQIVAGTRLPISRAYAALDYLVACRFLKKENEHLTRAGDHNPGVDPPRPRRQSMSRRGRTVAGTSAKKNRAARRHARSEADRWRHAGAAPPHALADPDQLSQLAQDHRDRREDPDAE